MSLSSPEPLTSAHPLENFDCGNSSLNSWLIRHARQAQAGGSAKTFVAADDDRIVGYYSLTVGQVDTLDAPERVRKGMGQYPFASCRSGATGRLNPRSRQGHWLWSIAGRHPTHITDG